MDSHSIRIPSLPTGTVTPGPKMAYPTTTTSAILCAALLLLSTSASASGAPTAWDVLEEYGLPRGLIPASVSSYSLRESDNFFTVTLPSPCYVQFADLVYFDTKITGYLNYGSIRELKGIEAQKFFLWVSISAVELDYASKQVEFKVGPLTQSYPISDFATVKKCQKNGLVSSTAGRSGAAGSSCRGAGSFFVPEVLALPVDQVE